MAVSCDAEGWKRTARPTESCMRLASVRAIGDLRRFEEIPTRVFIHVSRKRRRQVRIRCRDGSIIVEWCSAVEAGIIVWG